MCSHLVWFLIFIYFHTWCVRTAKALARLRGRLYKYHNLTTWLICLAQFPVAQMSDSTKIPQGLKVMNFSDFSSRVMHVYYNSKTSKILYGPRQANLVLIAYANSEGSGEPAHPRSLARTFAARSYKQWVRRNLQTESQIPDPSEWLGMPCAVKICHDGMLEDTNSFDGAQL